MADLNTTTNTTDPADESKGSQGEVAKSFTQADLTNVAASEKKQGKKAGVIEGRAAERAAMLEQMGMDEDSYAAYVEAIKSKQTDGDKLKSALGRISAFEAQLADEEGKSAENLAKLNEYKDRETLEAMGVTDPLKRRMYAATIREDVNEETDFKAAAEAFKTANPSLFEESDPAEPGKLPRHGRPLNKSTAPTEAGGQMSAIGKALLSVVTK